MTPEQWQRIRAVFDRAVEMPEEQVEGHLRAECDGDSELYREVRLMLDEHQRSGFLDHAPAAAATSQVTGFALSAGAFLSDRYRIVRPLGRGGMGEIYEAEDRELRERVALKTLIPEIAGDARMLARFKQEIRLARTIAHPNVCRVFDLARHPAEGSGTHTVFFFTMEFLDGLNLSERLQRGGRLPAGEAAVLVPADGECA